MKAALALHHDPPIELVYADRAGDIGLQVGGWLPRRTLPSGLSPVPGRLRAFDWRSGIDPELLPHLEIAGQGDRVTEVFLCNNPGDPTLVREGDDASAVYVVMPMRV